MKTPAPEQAERVDGARSVRAVRRCRAAVRWSANRAKGVIGIEMLPRSIEDVALADGACPDLPACPKDPVTAAPPTESACWCESDPDVLQTSPMLAAARCDFFFVCVIRVLGFVRPSNGQRSPAAAQD